MPATAKQRSPDALRASGTPVPASTTKAQPVASPDTAHEAAAGASRAEYTHAPVPTPGEATGTQRAGPVTRTRARPRTSTATAVQKRR
jgi:hypothetical protein